MPQPRTLFKEYGGSQRQKPHEELRHAMLRVTREYLDEMEQDSEFFKSQPLRSIPTLEPHELQLGKRIGMGEFGVVLEVSNISLQESPASCESDSYNFTTQKPLQQMHSKSCGSLPGELIPWEDTTEENLADTFAGTYSAEHQKLREIISGNILRESTSSNSISMTTVEQSSRPPSRFASNTRRPRFAVKQIRKDLYPKKKIEAAKDLAREVKFLNRLDHPNIVALRATVGNPGEERFMLLMDRLGTNLSEKVTEWHRQWSQETGGLGLPWKTSQRKAMERNILAERLTSLHDVAKAMQYLHQKSILFRDLKTENLARSYHGAFQLLDFGLAKEVKAKDRVEAEALELNLDRPYITEALYQLSGLTGTVRIMSPEVLKCEPYGLSADVYSFGVVAWEVFKGDLNRLGLAETVKGKRPELPVDGMPPRIESVLRKCFSDSTLRPTFAMLSQEFEYQLLELHEEEEWQRGVLTSTEVAGGLVSSSSAEGPTMNPFAVPLAALQF